MEMEATDQGKNGWEAKQRGSELRRKEALPQKRREGAAGKAREARCQGSQRSVLTRKEWQPVPAAQRSNSVTPERVLYFSVWMTVHDVHCMILFVMCT